MLAPGGDPLVCSRAGLRHKGKACRPQGQPILKTMRQRDIFLFWLPLYSSWLLMTGEGPLVSAAVNRLPDEVTMLAALGIVYSLAVLLESPIINLLATATALVGDHASYRQVRRFTVHWMVLLTALSYLLAMTPLFDAVVLRGLGVPPEIGAAVRPGLRILVPWSAAIAWRRFCQGVLIHFRRTRANASTIRGDGLSSGARTFTSRRRARHRARCTDAKPSAH